MHQGIIDISFQSGICNTGDVEMGSTNVTNLFIERIDDVFRHEIPEEVVHKARFSLLDYIGVTLAGRKMLESKLNLFIKDKERGRISAIGFKEKFNLNDAVFINGLNGHALDLDDGTNMGIIHLGSPIFSVLLPLAEKYHIKSDKFFKAAIIGYETSFTMALSIQPQHKQMGYHATGTCGVLGIAMAVSYMLDFTREQRRNAFAIASVSASGMLQVLDDGSELKPYNVGKSALLGLVASQMAQAGFSGNSDPLGNYRGFLKLFAGDETIKIKPFLYNGTYAIEKSYTKPYAACRYCHPSIEAAICLKNEQNIKAELIKSIEIKTYDLAVKGHDHVIIPNISSAKMSIPYGVACGILYGRAGLKEFDDKHIQNEQLLQLIQKIHVLEDAECSNNFPRKTTAIVKIQLQSGECYIKQVDFPKGEPENPLKNDEFDLRFLELATFGQKTEKEANNILKLVKNMNGDMSELFNCL